MTVSSFCHPPRGKKTNLCPKIRATQGKGVMPGEGVDALARSRRRTHEMSW